MSKDSTEEGTPRAESQETQPLEAPEPSPNKKAKRHAMGHGHRRSTGHGHGLGMGHGHGRSMGHGHSAAAATPSPGSAAAAQTTGYALIAVIYLLGLFIGALDTGIVTPCRTVIQNDLGVDDKLGVWLITIYTLSYAAAIPFMGKMADRHGRKTIYLVCVAFFGVGSLCCGLAQDIGSFEFLLCARVIQAIGGGGIMPISTAEFGTAFPPEKRGMALGLVGGVYGIANVFGASAGSLILDICGQSNWQFVFYINVPICLFIVLAGAIKLKNSDKSETKPIDVFGTLVLVVMVLSLLYALRNLDFFDFAASIATTNVYPFLIAFVVLLPLFIVIERKAKDPILNLSYFTNPNIIITMMLAIVTGVIMMGMVFVPQFAENATMMPSGKGGYWVILLGLFAGVGSPISGKLIDKFGVKFVLGTGLVASAVGSFFLAFVATAFPSAITVSISFIIVGLGIGFVMGTPINYMMLENTEDAEANSALATLSLMRSVGTAVAPAIMVAFLAHSGALVQDRIMEVLPNEIQISQLPYQQEVSETLEEYRNDPDTADMMANLDMPDLDSFNTVEIDMGDTSGDYAIPDDVLELLQSSDVCTIVDNTKVMASTMFDQMAPEQIAKITDGIEDGIAQMKAAQSDMSDAIDEMTSGSAELLEGISGIEDGISQQEQARSQMLEMEPMIAKVENYTSVLDFIPASAKANMPQQVLDQLAGVKTAADLQATINSLQSAIDTMNAQIEQMEQQKAGLEAGLAAAQGSAETSPESGKGSEGSEGGEEALDSGAPTDPASDPAQQIAQMEAAIAGIDEGISQMKAAVAAQEQAKNMLSEQMPTVQKLSNYNSVLDLMPASAKSAIPSEVASQLSGVRTTADLRALIGELDSAMETMRASCEEMQQAYDEMQQAIQDIQAASEKMDTTIYQLGVMEDAIPGAFDEAESTYLAAIDDKASEIQEVFQSTVDEGFRGMFQLVGICAVVGMGLLALYRSKSGKNKQQPGASPHGHGHGHGHGQAA